MGKQLTLIRRHRTIAALTVEGSVDAVADRRVGVVAEVSWRCAAHPRHASQHGGHSLSDASLTPAFYDGSSDGRPAMRQVGGGRRLRGHMLSYDEEDVHFCAGVLVQGHMRGVSQ